MGTIDEKCYLYGSCKCQTAGCVALPNEGCPVYRYFKDLIVKDYEARFKTGKWIVHRKSDGEVGYFQCSSCNHHSVVKFPYCPICGAEMDCNPNILSEMEAIPKDIYEARLKADLVAMLTELQAEIEEKATDLCDDGWWLTYNDIIQERIDKLKENKDEKK